MKVLISITVESVLAAAILASSLGCGHEIPTAPTSVAGESTPVARPVSSDVPAASGGLPGAARIEMVMPRSGTATVTLWWSDGDFSLQLYVTSGDCADVTNLLQESCTVLGSTRPGTRPGVITTRVRSGDSSTIWVLNSDPFPQGFTIDVEVNETMGTTVRHATHSAPDPR